MCGSSAFRETPRAGGGYSSTSLTSTHTKTYDAAALTSTLKAVWSSAAVPRKAPRAGDGYSSTSRTSTHTKTYNAAASTSTSKAVWSLAAVPRALVAIVAAPSILEAASNGKANDGAVSLRVATESATTNVSGLAPEHAQAESHDLGVKKQMGEEIEPRPLNLRFDAARAFIRPGECRPPRPPQLGIHMTRYPRVRTESLSRRSYPSLVGLNPS